MLRPRYRPRLDPRPKGRPVPITVHGSCDGTFPQSLGTACNMQTCHFGLCEHVCICVCVWVAPQIVLASLYSRPIAKSPTDADGILLVRVCAMTGAMRMYDCMYVRSMALPFWPIFGNVASFPRGRATAAAAIGTAVDLCVRPRRGQHSWVLLQWSYRTSTKRKF